MDNDLVDLCNKIIRHFNDNNYEYIIGFLLREIHGNDLVYINMNNNWYKYDEENKKWNIYNFDFLLNLEKLHNFFDKIIILYLLNNELLNDNNKKRLKRISRNIANYIFESNINKETLQRHCCAIFSINEGI